MFSLLLILSSSIVHNHSQWAGRVVILKFKSSHITFVFKHLWQYFCSFTVKAEILILAYMVPQFLWLLLLTFPLSHLMIPTMTLLKFLEHKSNPMPRPLSLFFLLALCLKCIFLHICTLPSLSFFSFSVTIRAIQKSYRLGKESFWGWKTWEPNLWKSKGTVWVEAGDTARALFIKQKFGSEEL